MNLPAEHINVMITYNGLVRANCYGDSKPSVVIRRAFYSKSDGFYNAKNEWVETPNGYFSVPQYWREFIFSDGATALLPHGFRHHGRVLPENIIDWKLDK